MTWIKYRHLNFGKICIFQNCTTANSKPGLQHHTGLDARSPDFVAYEQQTGRPACTSAQSDQRLCYSLSEMQCNQVRYLFILQFLFVCLFCCFTSQVNSYGHGGTVSLSNHTFSWASLNKQLTSTLCTLQFFDELQHDNASGYAPTGTLYLHIISELK